jgi:hypothetical protein
MLEQRRAKTSERYQKTVLYRLVFDSYLIWFAAILLFFFVLLQPLAPVFAFGVGVENSEVPQTVEAEETPQTLVDSFGEEAAPVIDVKTPEGDGDGVSVDAGEPAESATLSEEGYVPQNPEPAEWDTTETTQSTEGQFDSDASEQVSEEAEPTTTSTESTSTSSTSLPTEVESDVATTTGTTVTEGVPEETVEPVTTPLATTTATSTLPITVLQEPIVEHNAGGLKFDTKECVSVGDGAYYCSEIEKATDPLNDSVFAAPDSDGDLEIYVRLGGNESQLTSNNVDDSAPYYDALSERIVWHQLKNERFQIISYDLDSSEETVLTNTAYNNMEPVAYEEITLWQAWIGGNWEIMLFDGEQVMQLTNNTLQDVSPHMRGGYIVWQTQFADGWQVAVYDQESKKIEYIPSESGLKVENPRFVLVYDSTDNNGDVQTLGYDLDNKTVIALGSVPVELPDELPEPDQTGETRALIQNKQSSKEGELEVNDIIQGNTNTSSSTQNNTLDLTSSQPPTAISSSTTTDVIDDLIVAPYSTTTATSADPIVEIVIPPFVSTSTEEIR